MLIYEMFKNADPRHLAYVGTSTVTYGELEKAVDCYRNTLYALGIRKGDRVGLYTANCAEFVYVYMGVTSLGAIIVPINNSLVDREVDYILKDAGAKLLVSDTPLTVSCDFIELSRLNEKAFSENTPAAPDVSGELSEETFVSGGASLPQPVAQAFFKRFGHPIQEGYGLTEASPVVSVLPTKKPKYLTSGPALPGVEVKILTEKEGPYVAGTVGELLVRGDNVMKGYWKKPEETAKVLTEDGWLHTGDLAYLDDDRYIYIVDRIKDLIIMNGENIYPGEVEDCIYEVEGVGECAVIGHPDPLRGQSVWAYVVMKEGYAFDEDKIRDYMQKNIAPYKIPRRFIPMDALPKNATGKILKRALRDEP